MSQPIVYLCPGQGAQSVGMGKAWFDASPDAARTFGAADEILEPVLGLRLSDICFNGPLETLSRTDIAQPALYTAGVACYQALSSSGSQMAAAAGLSLGEYTALHIAGVLSFQDGLMLVAKRGKAMQDAAEAVDSSMVALIGADEAQADTLCARVKELLPSETLVPANYNAPGQIVISGTVKACKQAIITAQDLELRAKELTVAGAFHSPLMQPAAEELAEALRTTEINDRSIPVYSNVTAHPHKRVHAQELTQHARMLICPEAPPEHELSFADSVRARLLEQLTSSVRWAHTCDALSTAYSGTDSEAVFHELAPGKVLSGLMRKVSRQTKVTSHDIP